MQLVLLPSVVSGSVHASLQNFAIYACAEDIVCVCACVPLYSAMSDVGHGALFHSPCQWVSLCAPLPRILFTMSPFVTSCYIIANIVSYCTISCIYHCVLNGAYGGINSIHDSMQWHLSCPCRITWRPSDLGCFGKNLCMQLINIHLYWFKVHWVSPN